MLQPVCHASLSSLLQSVQTVLGQVSALTWVLSVDPSMLPGGPEVVSVAKEAFALADKEEALLLQRLPGRNLSVETLTQLRVACIDLLNVLMAWEPFRTYPEPVGQGRGLMQGRAGAHPALDGGACMLLPMLCAPFSGQCSTTGCPVCNMICPPWV